MESSHRRGWESPSALKYRARVLGTCEQGASPPCTLSWAVLGCLGADFGLIGVFWELLLSGPLLAKQAAKGLNGEPYHINFGERSEELVSLQFVASYPHAHTS